MLRGGYDEEGCRAGRLRLWATVNWTGWSEDQLLCSVAEDVGRQMRRTVNVECRRNRNNSGKSQEHKE